MTLPHERDSLIWPTYYMPEQNYFYKKKRLSILFCSFIRNFSFLKTSVVHNISIYLCYADMFTLGCHWQQWLCPAVCLSVPNDVTALTLRISTISLKCDGVMHSGMKQIIVENAHVRTIFVSSIEVWNFAMVGFIGSDGRWLILRNVGKAHCSLKFGGIMQHTMKQITIWNGHTQSIFAFSDFGWLRVLSFYECLLTCFGETVYISDHLDPSTHRFNFMRNIFLLTKLLHNFFPFLPPYV